MICHVNLLAILSARVEYTGFGVRDRIRELTLISKDVRVDVGGAINHSMVCLVMGHDDAEGIKNNKLQIEWPGVGKQEVFERINKELFQHAKAIGATFIGNPVWELLNARKLVTAHPLGGCPMGETSNTGMVDSKGNVFSGHGEKDTHPGLFVADGSNIPTAVGVNPFFTISAISEHIAKCIINELK